MTAPRNIRISKRRSRFVRSNATRCEIRRFYVLPLIYCTQNDNLSLYESLLRDRRIQASEIQRVAYGTQIVQLGA